MQKTEDLKSLSSVGLLCLLAFAILGGTRPISAQSLPTASKSSDIFVFGGYTDSRSDYGRFRNTGGSAGLDYTRYFGWRVVPSFEVRANYTTGPDITEKALLAGLRLQADFHRFHPYGDGFVGVSGITFAVPPNRAVPNYTTDNAFASAFGGGVDIDIVPAFQAKIDYEYEFTNFGPNGTQPGNADFTLTPSMWTAGIVYRLPIGRHK